MSWMDGVEKDLRNLGVVNWITRAQGLDGWSKFLRADQDPQRVVVRIIIIQ
jgi:hypothetical protein